MISIQQTQHGLSGARRAGKGGPMPRKNPEGRGRKTEARSQKPKGAAQPPPPNPGEAPAAPHLVTLSPCHPVSPKRRPRKERIKRPNRIHEMRRAPTGQLIRNDATPEEIEAIVKRSDKRKPRAATVFNRFRVDALLTREDREEYERMAECPAISAKELHAWLLERGYEISLDAVRHHRTAFYNQVKSVRMTARMASD